MDTLNITRNFAYLFAGAALVIGFQTIVGDAYAQPAEEQTTSGIYVTVVLAVISLVNSLFSTYLAQKAKMTGQAPNETDLRQQQQLVDLQTKLTNSAGAIANLVDFIGTKVAPEQFNQIAEGTLPYIKAKEVVKKVGEIQSDVKHGEDLLNEIQAKVK
jgi:hypothetical protein